MLEEVEKEISRLQQVAELLRGGTSASPKQRGKGKGKGKGTHTMSKAGRRKISIAQKARWAKVHAAAKKSA
jgi:hypothetical protein